MNGVSDAMGSYQTCADTKQQLDSLEAAITEMRDLKQTILDTGASAWRDAVVTLGADVMCQHVPVEFCEQMETLLKEKLCAVVGGACVEN